MLQTICPAQLMLYVLLLFPVSLAVPDCSREKDTEVLILGAGFAGLTAARTLSENGIEDFLIIETRDKIGGRAQSVKFGGVTVEIGPQWILFADGTRPIEQQNPLLRLAHACNITLRDSVVRARGIRVRTRDGIDITRSPEVLGAFARFTAASSPEMIETILEGLGDDEDLSLAAGLRVGGWLPRGAIDEWVEYFGVDLLLAEPAGSLGYRGFLTPEVRSEQSAFGSTSYIVTDDIGYVGLAQCIAGEFLRSNDDPRLVLETTVQSVAWNDECVCATVNQNGEEKQYCGRHAIVTFGTGVLQNRAVRFEPDLPTDIFLTFNRLQMGRFLKVYARFNETFWDTDVDFIGIVDETTGREYYPLFAPWGAFFPSNAPVVQAFVFGDDAERVTYLDKEVIRQQIGEVFRNVYGNAASDPIDVILGDYIRDPYFYGNFGGVSTVGVTNKTYQLLNEPIGNMFLAGDGVAYSHHSSANGAFFSGINAGNRLVNIIRQPPKVTFTNDSPRVSGRSVSANFTVSKTVSLVQCSIDGQQRTDCSSGSVEYTNLSEGTHRLKIIARNAAVTDRGVVLSSVYISDDAHCAVQLINGGASVFEGKVTVEFTSTGQSAATFRCNVDGVNMFPCTSPLRLDDLSSGRHRIRIRPMCAGDQRQLSFSVFIP